MKLSAGANVTASHCPPKISYSNGNRQGACFILGGRVVLVWEDVRGGLFKNYAAIIRVQGEKLCRDHVVEKLHKEPVGQLLPIRDSP